MGIFKEGASHSLYHMHGYDLARYSYENQKIIFPALHPKHIIISPISKI